MRKYIVMSIIGILSNGLSVLMFVPIDPQKHIDLDNTFNKVLLAIFIFFFILSLISLIVWGLLKYSKLLWLPKMFAILSCTVGIPLFIFLGYFFMLFLFDIPLIPPQD